LEHNLQLAPNSVDGTSSGGNSAQQQNFLGLNESFSNFSNLRD